MPSTVVATDKDIPQFPHIFFFFNLQSQTCSFYVFYVGSFFFRGCNTCLQVTSHYTKEANREWLKSGVTIVRLGSHLLSSWARCQS